MTEQDVISSYFSRHISHGDVNLSVGDDAAVVTPPSNSKLVITTDTLNLGVHFDECWPPESIGYKALAVCLSDLAAMGAEPLWATLNLTLDRIDKQWLQKFSDGIYELADFYKVKIIGGDLVKGPLSITIQAIGCTQENFLTRSNAKAGDLIFVTGTIGDAAYGLKLHEKSIKQNTSEEEYFLSRFYNPIPRVDIGQSINKFANSAIDISDGLLKDLQRILKSSNLGAEIDFNLFPFSEELQELDNSFNFYLEIITGGEDFELLFTADESCCDVIENISKNTKCPITKIGHIKSGDEFNLLSNGSLIALPRTIGFDHFG